MTNLLRYMKEKSNYNTKEEAVEFLIMKLILHMKNVLKPTISILD